jgi:hypothetical protein
LYLLYLYIYYSGFPQYNLCTDVLYEYVKSLYNVPAFRPSSGVIHIYLTYLFKAQNIYTQIVLTETKTIKRKINTKFNQNPSLGSEVFKRDINSLKHDCDNISLHNVLEEKSLTNSVYTHINLKSSRCSDLHTHKPIIKTLRKYKI